MICSKQDCELFFSLFDALTDYANGKWGIAPAVIDAASGFVNEMNQRKVANEVWRNTGIIDELAAENPFGFTRGELDILLSWKNCYSDRFFVVQKRPGTVHFLSADTAFEVSGISREIISMLNDIPTVVQATLLPFRGRIVYGVYLDEMPVLLGSGLQRMVDDDWDRITAAGKLLSSDGDLIAALPKLREALFDREAQMMLDSLEAEMRQNEPIPGTHRGILAGLSGQDRENAKKKAGSTQALRNASSYFPPFAPKETLFGMLMELYRDELQTMAKRLGVRCPSKMNKNQLSAAIVERLCRPEELLPAVATLGQSSYRALKEVYGKGGSLSLDLEGENAPDALYPYIPFLLDAGCVGNKLLYRIPEESMQALGQLDWQYLDASQKQSSLLSKIVNFMLEIRGVVALQEVLDEYLKHSEDPLGYEELMSYLAFQSDVESSLHVIFIPREREQEIYLVHIDIIESIGGKEDGYMETVVIDSLPAEAHDLVNARNGKDPRPLTEEMLSVGSYERWLYSRPSTQALRDWLDEHVPDGEDDLHYADDIVVDLAYMATQGYPMKAATEYLSEALVCGDVNQLNKVLQLLTNMANSLPNWLNNGWSANELVGGLFFNEDGSPKRIGPFESCPCGSGKQYKDCHGKN